MEYIFDLKGSKLGRYTIPVAHKKRTLKDENFIRMNKQKQVCNELVIYIYIANKH